MLRRGINVKPLLTERTLTGKIRKRLAQRFQPPRTAILHTAYRAWINFFPALWLFELKTGLSSFKPTLPGSCAGILAVKLLTRLVVG